MKVLRCDAAADFYIDIREPRFQKPSANPVVQTKGILNARYY